ncbi:hypothetical protein R1flu_010413 [Riccia fluitans]|uniref:Uncharacterized protein n=1 Tax=Riccia fluitans TaxID=41844 RepID=A0ABD1Z586_9MARC
MVNEAAGQRLPTIRLMDEELYKANTMEQIRRFCSRIQFVPYSSKELKDLDHVKISTMYYLNMLKYVTSLQRHCVPEDMFLWGITNTDIEAKRWTQDMFHLSPVSEHTHGGHHESTSTELGRTLESIHFPTGAILGKDLHDTSNEDSPVKPPNVSIPVQAEPSLLTPLPIFTIVIGQPGHLPSTERQSMQELSAHLRRDITQVINSHLLPFVEVAFQGHSAAIDTWKKCYEDQLSKVCELQATNDGLREQLVAKDAEKSDVHALARTEVQCELEEFKRSVTEKEKAAKETHL